MYRRSGAGWLTNLDYMLLDIVWLNLAFVIAYALRFPGQGLPYASLDYRSLVIVMMLIQMLLSLAMDNLAKVSSRSVAQETVAVVTLSFSLITASTFYLFVTKSSIIYSRLFIFYLAIVLVIVSTSGRVLWKWLLNKKFVTKKLGGEHTRSVLIIAENTQDAEFVAGSLDNDEINRFVIKGFVLMAEADTNEVMGIPVVSNIENAPDYICREWIDEIFISALEKAVPAEFLDCCAEMGLTVHRILDVQGVNTNKRFIENIGGVTVVTTAFNYIETYQAVAKRIVDIVGGLAGCAMAVLIGLVIGPIIYINSPGPIIFRQKRIGRNGKPFWVLKFRSMYLDAEDRKQSLMTENRVSDGMMFKMDFDPRIIGNKTLPDGRRKTGIGEFIRKTSLDEFPQFFNVLKGEMSLVGTRPPTVDEWKKYKYHHRARLAIRPGITGLWQVSGRSEITDFEEVVRLDTEYIMKYRLLLDVKILLKTVAVLLKRKGAM